MRKGTLGRAHAHTHTHANTHTPVLKTELIPDQGDGAETARVRNRRSGWREEIIKSSWGHMYEVDILLFTTDA